MLWPLLPKHAYFRMYFRNLALLIPFLKTENDVQLECFLKYVIPLHALRYLYIAPFRKFKSLQMSSLHICRILTRQRKLQHKAENLQGSTAVADPGISTVKKFNKYNICCLALVYLRPYDSSFIKINHHPPPPLAFEYCIRP